MTASSLMMLAFFQAGQAAEPPRDPGLTPELRKGLARLDAETAAAVRQLERHPVPAGVATTLRLIHVGKADPKVLAKAVMKRYGGRPGFLAVGLPEVEAVLMRADAKTKEEAGGFLSGLLPLGSQDVEADQDPGSE